MSSSEKMVDKRNSLIIIVCISTLLLLNVLLALYNWGLFECFYKKQHQDLRVKIKLPKFNSLEKKDEIHSTTSTSAPSSTTTTTSTEKPRIKGKIIVKKNGPIKFTFTKMIRFTPKKLLRSQKKPSDFSSIPTPEGFDRIFSNQPPTPFDDLPPLDPISLPGPFPFMHDMPPPQDGPLPLPPGLGLFLNKLMPNLDDIVRDLAGPHENPVGPQFMPPRPDGELFGDCIVCSFEDDQNGMKMGPVNEDGDLKMKEEGPKVTEVKAVLPQSIFPEDQEKPKKKVRHSLLIFMAPKKFGKDLTKMDPLPPFLPPILQNDKPIMDLPEGGPIREFSGVLPPSFPFHMMKEEGETPEKDLLSVLADTLHGNNNRDDEFNDELHYDPLPPKHSGIKIIHSKNKKEKAIPVGPAPNGGSELNAKSKKDQKEGPISHKMDTVPIFRALDFSPKAVKADDIEKLATLEKVGSKNKKAKSNSPKLPTPIK